jgi:hypothetical protein
MGLEEHKGIQSFKHLKVNGNLSFWVLPHWRWHLLHYAWPVVHSVHNTDTSTRSLQLCLIKKNHKDFMCNSLPKWNAQFHYRLQTIQSLRLLRLRTKTMCDNLITHTIDHNQCNPMAFPHAEHTQTLLSM